MIAAAVIFILGRWVAMGVRGLVRRVMARSKVDPTLISFVGSLTYIGLLAFVIVAALGQLGIQTASFIAILGAAGLAVGPALQGSLANFAAGVLLIIFRPFKVNDFIEGGGVAGKEPAPLIAVAELADSSVNFVVRPWVNAGDYWNVHFSLTETIKKRFDAEGISIPFPQRDVHLYEHKAEA